MTDKIKKYKEKEDENYENEIKRRKIKGAYIKLR